MTIWERSKNACWCVNQRRFERADGVWKNSWKKSLLGMKLSIQEQQRIPKAYSYKLTGVVTEFLRVWDATASLDETQPGRFRIWIDAAYKNGKATSAVLIRCVDGQILFLSTETFKACSSFEVELRAVLFGVRSSNDKGWRYGCVESDAN